jgi:hypothetical protein
MLAGCSTSDRPKLPDACRSGPAAVRTALTSAPGQVRVRGVRLSECFTESAEASDIQVISATFLDVASDLSDRARSHPEGPDALRLGYLIGATERGAAHTQGIHTEMVRRLETEPAGLRERSAAYRRGLRAGRASG